MHLLHSLIISYALDAYLFRLYCYIITLTKNKGAKMSIFQKAILKRIDIFLKMFSNLLIILTNESSFKSKTNKEINIVVPKINEVVKTINKNIYDN